MNVQAELETFEAICDRWIAALDEYDEAKWRRSPAPGVWSMSQVHSHILDVAGLALGQLRKCQERTETKARKTLAGHLVYLLGGLPPIRVKAPAAINNAPPEPESKVAVRDALLSVKSQMHELAPHVHAARGAAKHPILGKLTAAEWFRFMEMHMRHHLRQKKRIDQMLASR